MHKLTHKLKELGWRRIALSFVVLAYLGFLGLINVMMVLPDNWISAMGHFNFVNTGDTHNLVHELVFALIVGTAAVGLFSQLWKPKENFAGQLVALIAWIAMILAAAFTNNWVPQPLFIVFGGLTLLSTILHPAGRGLFNWPAPLEAARARSVPLPLTGFSVARINRALFVLVVIAALPFTVFAFTNINLQLAGGGGAGLFGAHNRSAFHGGGTDQNLSADEDADHDREHITVGHYRNMAVLSFIIIFVGLLASFRPLGWRFAAWVAGFLPILLGFASVVLPGAESSLGVVWGIIAIAWGTVFIAMAEFISRGEQVYQYSQS